MVISTKRNNRGRKARIGGICFDEGKMMIFAGYHYFPDGKTGKILLDLAEARELANRIGYDRKRERRKELIRWLAKRYEI